jgi:hypothetical protein
MTMSGAMIATRLGVLRTCLVESRAALATRNDGRARDRRSP